MQRYIFRPHGINVSIFDTDALESDRLSYCGHADNKGDEAALAKILAAKIGEEGEIAILSGTLSAHFSNHIWALSSFLFSFRFFITDFF